MGSLCSKSGTVIGGHQVLGSGPSGPGADPAALSRPVDPRRAAAEAAERRQREVRHTQEHIAPSALMSLKHGFPGERAGGQVHKPECRAACF